MLHRSVNSIDEIKDYKYAKDELERVQTARSVHAGSWRH